MGVFTEEIEFVKQDIDEFGKDLVWRKLINTDLPDEAKPWQPGDYDVEDFPVRILLIPFNKEDRQTQKYPKDSSISSGSVMGLMAAGGLEFEPKLRDVVIDGEQQIKVTNINKLSPNGEDILYFLELSY